MLILDPRNPDPAAPSRLPALHALPGTRLAWLDNGWGSMQRLRETLTPHFAAAGIVLAAPQPVPRNHGAPQALLDQVARDSDAAIVGLAN